MEKKKKSAWALLNPLEWINTAFAMLAWIMGPIMRWLGLVPPPRTDGFQNIQKSDVDEASEQAQRTEEAVDAIVRQMSPADVVKAYASASPEGRAEMDLNALDTDGVDWLLGLSEDDLTLLAMSTTAGCARSLEAREVKPKYSRPVNESETPETLTIPSVVDEDEWRKQQISARYRQVQRELGLSTGIPTLEPKHVPRPTLH